MNIINILYTIVTVSVSLISTSYCQYNDNSYYKGYRNYGRQYSAYRVRPVSRGSYGRGYEKSYGELHKPIVYPNRYHGYPGEDYPIEHPIPISPDLEPDYNWYKEQEIKKLFKSFPMTYGKYYKGMTFYSKSKPIYIEKKPIIKIVKQPVYVKQPIVIKKQPVIHKEEVVTVDKKPAVVTEVKVPVVEVTPDIDKRISGEEKHFEHKQLVKEEKTAIEKKPESPVVVDKPEAVDKPVAVDKTVVDDKSKEESKPAVQLNDKNKESDKPSSTKEQFDEKKPLPELEDP